MSTPRTPALRYIAKPGTFDPSRAVVEFVGGPRGGQREHATDIPETISALDGTYRRSVRCADDGALRYVFEADPTAVAHERLIRPC